MYLLCSNDGKRILHSKNTVLTLLRLMQIIDIRTFYYIV